MKGNDAKPKKDRIEEKAFRLSQDQNPTHFKSALIPPPFRVNLLELALSSAIASGNRRAIHSAVELARLAGMI